MKDAQKPDHISRLPRTPHIHLAKGKQRNAPGAKFWLESLVLANNRGLNASDLRNARQIVEENRELFLEMWDEHCNN
jgi:hypothetical protein